VSAILFIDDKPEQLSGLTEGVRSALGGREVELRTWIPAKDENPRRVFDERLGTDTTLVVTDQDLTEGQTGLFGSTIVEWCQQSAVPVADYSRGRVGDLKNEPDLFEIRVPRTGDAASFVTGVYLGFMRINDAISVDKDLWSERSPAAVLARIVDAPRAEADFALYAVRLAAASGALTSRVIQAAQPDQEPSQQTKRALLSYIVGHLLLNAVLRYPGPILSLRSLGAYLAITNAGAPKVLNLFESARYSGPFAELDTFHWLSRVDEILESIIPREVSTETNGELHRKAVEASIGEVLERHSCPRCNGQNGGFLCPFTRKTVCLRPDCSVGSNSWIPQGARLCRIEREFFDEWSPILGL